MKSFIKQRLTEELNERYEQRLAHRLENIPATIKNSPKWARKGTYHTDEINAREYEIQAFKNAKSKGNTDVYRVINLNGLVGTLNGNSEISVSTDNSKKLNINFQNKTDNFILKGNGPLVAWYDRDVSTNKMVDNGNTDYKTAMEPNAPKSTYDEALVIGKDINWDTIYINGKLFDENIKKQIKEICDKNNIMIVDYSQGVNNLPNLVKNSIQ